MNQKATDGLKAALENPYLWRNVLAIVGMASLLLPWTKLDGAASAMSGADMIAYLFTGAERWEMLRTRLWARWPSGSSRCSRWR